MSSGRGPGDRGNARPCGSRKCRPVSWTARVVLAAMALLAGAPASALDPERALSQYQLDVWQTEHGLPQNTVTAIVRTRDGNLWFGTYEGLVRFDGASFTVFDGKASRFLAKGSTLSLMEDRKGGLWLGRSENVVRYERGVFEQVLDTDVTGHGTAWSICEAPDGTVWIAGSKGLLRWRDGKTTLLTIRDGLPTRRLSSVCVDREGTLWVGTHGGGLVSLGPGDKTFTVRSTKNGWPHDRVLKILPDPSGGIWAGTAGGGLVRLIGETVRVYGRADGLPTEQVDALTFDSNGALWAGTSDAGIAVLRQGRFQTLGSPPLSNDSIWALLGDDEGALWIGTWVGGLNRLRDRKFAVYGVPEGLSNDNVRSVLHARDGSVWLAPAGGGLNRIRDGRVVEVLRQSDGLPSDHVASLCEGRDGTLWAGTYSAGLARIRSGRIEALGKSAGLPGTDVRAIVEDRDGAVWAATTAGVAYSRDGRRFERLATPEGLSLGGVNCFLQDRNGAFWFATSGDGLVRYDATGFKVLTTRDGLVSNRLMSVLEDREGTLWIGSARDGLNRLKDGRLSSIHPEDGLGDGMVQVLLEDRSGGIWTTGNNGFRRLSKEELSARAEGRPGAIHPLAFGRADGLRSTTFAGAQQPAGSVGPDGRLWLPSYRGVVVVDPARIPPAAPPPGVRAEEVLVDGVRRAEPGAIEIGPGRQNVEFRYAPTTLQPLELIRFRYRLEGFDPGWSDVGPRRIAYYTGLPPGRYTFRASCRNGDGPWGTEARLFTLVVRPALHERWWFRLLVPILGVAGAVLAFRLRTFQLRQRQAEMERTVAARTRELSLKSALLAAQSEAAPDGILAIDPEERVLLLNERFAQLWGIPDRPEEATAEPGVPGWILGALADPDEFSGKIRYLGDHPAEESHDEIELKDGRAFDRRSRPLKGDEGAILGRVWYFRDITEKRRAEEELRMLHGDLERRVRLRTAELTEANRELEAYSYSVSHELRSPLRAIDGFATLITSRYAGLLDEEGRRLFGRVRWNAQRMGRLIDDLLDFSRAGRADFTPKAIDMTRSAKKALARAAEHPDFPRAVSMSVGDLPGAVGDAALVGRVWENLVSNAVKFSAQRERPEIRIEGAVAGGEAVYHVRDNGVGFDMQYVGKLFGVFHRLHAADEFEGTGVGLALVRRIVARHGGRVWAEGELGRGATFSFSLPVNDGSASRGGEGSEGRGRV